MAAFVGSVVVIVYEAAAVIAVMKQRCSKPEQKSGSLDLLSLLEPRKKLVTRHPCMHG